MSGRTVQSPYRDSKFLLALRAGRSGLWVVDGGKSCEMLLLGDYFMHIVAQKHDYGVPLGLITITQNLVYHKSFFSFLPAFLLL